MIFLRIILLIMVWLFIRRLYAGWRRGVAQRRRNAHTAGGANPPGSDPAAKTDKYGDLTQQKVSDADFEEIP